MSESEITTRLLRIYGRVQGVGYRLWTQHMAEQCRVTGWVRNRQNGSVEILAHGVEDNIERFVNECYEGPDHASVEAVHAAIGSDEDLNDFEIRETV